MTTMFTSFQTSKSNFYFQGGFLPLGLTKTQYTSPWFRNLHNEKLITWSQWDKGEPDLDREKCAYIRMSNKVIDHLITVANLSYDKFQIDRLHSWLKWRNIFGICSFVLFSDEPHFLHYKADERAHILQEVSHIFSKDIYIHIQYNPLMMDGKVHVSGIKPRKGQTVLANLNCI